MDKSDGLPTLEYEPVRKPDEPPPTGWDVLAHALAAAPASIVGLWGVYELIAIGAADRAFPGWYTGFMLLGGLWLGANAIQRWQASLRG